MRRRCPSRWFWLLLLTLLWTLASCSADKQTFMVPMADGVGLATDVWLPKGKGPWPVAFARTPYDKNAITGEAFNAKGIALVVQDVRGRFASQGEARPFLPDGWAFPADGRTTARWTVKQPWCNGKTATFGGSAVGITQYLLAGTAPPGLVACYPVVAPASLYHGTFFEGGVFRQSMVEGWLKLAKWPDYAMEDILKHPDYDAHWRHYDLRTRAKYVNVPMMHVGGWYDIFTQGTIDAFVALQTGGGKGARGRQHLIMGPWTHGIKQNKIGQLTFPDSAKWPEGAPDEGRWIESFLVHGGTEMDALPAVWYYVMGDPTNPTAPGNRWRTAGTWPPRARETTLYLTDDHRLDPSLPKAGVLTYTYDPKNPVPTVGGRELLLPAGPFDQRSIENRPDVLLFTGPELAKPMEVTGRIAVRLFAASTARDTDWTAKLTDVYPDGRSMLIADGILRARFRNGFARERLMKPGVAYEFDLDIGSTSTVLNRGHRVRLAVSSSNAPRYEPNPNTGDRWRANDRVRTAQQTVRLGKAHASQLVLPVVGG